MKNEIKRLVKKYKEMAESVYGCKFLPINIDFTPRRSMTAGTAYFGMWKVWINIPVHEAKPDMLEDTVAHEVAHLIAYKVYGPIHGRGHGLRWKQVMVSLGQKPERTYKGTLEQKLAGKNTTRHIYRCECGHELNMSAKRHNQIRRGAGVFHKGCRGKTLTFVRTTSKHAIVREQMAAQKKAAGVDVPPYHAPKPAPKRVPTMKTAMSKLDRCRKVFDASKSRAENIRIFVALDCTPAGAATYYAKIKKEAS